MWQKLEETSYPTYLACYVDLHKKTKKSPSFLSAKTSRGVARLSSRRESARAVSGQDSRGSIASDFSSSTLTRPTLKWAVGGRYIRGHVETGCLVQQLPHVGHISRSKITFFMQCDLGGAIPSFLVERRASEYLSEFCFMRTHFQKDAELDEIAREKTVLKISKLNSVKYNSQETKDIQEATQLFKKLHDFKKIKLKLANSCLIASYVTDNKSTFVKIKTTVKTNSSQALSFLLNVESCALRSNKETKRMILNQSDINSGPMMGPHTVAFQINEQSSFLSSFGLKSERQVKMRMVWKEINESLVKMLTSAGGNNINNNNAKGPLSLSNFKSSPKLGGLQGMESNIKPKGKGVVLPLTPVAQKNDEKRKRSSRARSFILNSCPIDVGGRHRRSLAGRLSFHFHKKESRTESVSSVAPDTVRENGTVIKQFFSNYALGRGDENGARSLSLKNLVSHFSTKPFAVKISDTNVEDECYVESILQLPTRGAVAKKKIPFILNDMFEVREEIGPLLSHASHFSLGNP